MTPKELQVQYSNYKSNLQQIAQKIGDVEQEAEEHKYLLQPRSEIPSDASQPPRHIVFTHLQTRHTTGASLTADRAPCRLVLETLEPLPRDRKCFRMINGVLIERTVKDVIPALKTNSDGLKKVLDELLKQYKVKQDELEKWKVCCFFRFI
jgi:prefoldin subunit 2